MSRNTAESLLISAVINSQDPYAAKDYGIKVEHFHGHQAEYAWLMDFAQRFHRTPTPTEFLAHFDNFNYSSDQEDARWPADEVLRAYSSRQLTRAMLSATMAVKAGNIEEAFGHFNGLRFQSAVAKPQNMLVDYGFLDDYDKPEDLVPVPWPTLQGAVEGIGQGELWYLAARPGVGKSASLLEFAATAALFGRKVCFYSLEMTKRQVQVRMHAIIARKLGMDVSEREMRARRYDRLAYKQLLETIEANVPGEVHVFTPAEGMVTPSVVSSRATEYDLNIVDYIGLMREDGMKRAVDDWRTIAVISNELKEIPLAKNTRMLIASQINREGDTQSFRPPKLKHLSQSDALGQDADKLLTACKYGDGARAFSLEKNRQGVSGVLWWTKFDPDKGDFTEITRDDADDIKDESDD